MILLRIITKQEWEDFPYKFFVTFLSLWLLCPFAKKTKLLKTNSMGDIILHNQNLSSISLTMGETLVPWAGFFGPVMKLPIHCTIC
jgi:hypothetical protein